MILSVRGTSGAGKTHVARRVLHDPGVYHAPEPVFVEGRKRPMYYVRDAIAPGRRGIAILGSYENATGGCDTISGNDIPFELIRQLYPTGRDVFFEGLLMSAEQHRTAKLHADGMPVHLFYFGLTLAECLAGVNARRAERGVTEPVNPKTTASRHSAIMSERPGKLSHPTRFKRLGLNVRVGDRDDAVAWLRELGVLAS